MNIIVSCPTVLSRGAETFGHVQPSTPSCVWPPPVQAMDSSPVPVYYCSESVTFPACVGCAFTLPCRAFLLHCEDAWGVDGIWPGSPDHKVPAVTIHWGQCGLVVWNQLQGPTPLQSYCSWGSQEYGCWEVFVFGYTCSSGLCRLWAPHQALGAGRWVWSLLFPEPKLACALLVGDRGTRAAVCHHRTVWGKQRFCACLYSLSRPPATTTSHQQER